MTEPLRNEPALTRLSEHVYWLPPDAPVRPSLCAVVGDRHTLMLDAGASTAHARLFLDLLAAQGISAPRIVALTHWHWDHVFGADALGVPVIAHAETTERLAGLASQDWSDAGLAARVAAGDQSAAAVEQLKLELPAPRDVRIAKPTVVFHDALELYLSGFECRIQHVGGDHAPDSSVMFVMPDRVLFLGDCLYGSVSRPGTYTTRRLLPLTEALLAFGAEQVVSGHSPAILKRAEFELYVGKIRLAATLVEQLGENETEVLAAAQAQTGQPPDNDVILFVRALIAGNRAE